MEQYITDVVARYRGRVQEWSIANEASDRDFAAGADFWFDKIGRTTLGWPSAPPGRPTRRAC